MAKITVCDICGRSEPEVKHYSFCIGRRKVQLYLMDEIEDVCNEYDLCLCCYKEILLDVINEMGYDNYAIGRFLTSKTEKRMK